MATANNDPPSPGHSDIFHGTQPVDDSCLRLDTPSEFSSKTDVSGHQVVNTPGGSNPNLRVLECTQVHSSFEDYKMIFNTLSSFGTIQRIKMVLTPSEKYFDSYTTFANSVDAFSALEYLRENGTHFCKKSKIISVTNLKDDAHDYIPEIFVPEEEKEERVLPIPTWHVARYKEGRANMIKGAKTIQEKVGNIPRGNLKRYGNSLLIKAGNKTQAALLSRFKPSPEGNIDSISPHKSFNISKGIIYSRDLYEFSDEEILETCPANVFKVQKLKNNNSDKPNNAILLTFTTNYVPDYIFIEHSRIKVKKFYRRPTQCFKCFEFGHGVDNCKNLKKCNKCSGEHKSLENCTNSTYCFLCEGDHSPRSRDCPRFKFEQEVLDVANNQYISIGNAKQMVMGANRTPHSTYAKVVNKLKSNSFRASRKESPPTKTHESAPRTEIPISVSPEVESTLNNPSGGTKPRTQGNSTGASPNAPKHNPSGGTKPRTQGNSTRITPEAPKPKEQKEKSQSKSDAKKEKAPKRDKPLSKSGGNSKKSSRDDTEPNEGSVPTKRIKSHKSSENVPMAVEVSNSFAVLNTLEGHSDFIVGSAPKPQRTRSVEDLSRPFLPSSHSIPRVRKLNFNNALPSQSPPKAHAAGKQANN